ncbi:MAG: phosphotransferase [Planctomycetota bacterium]
MTGPRIDATLKQDVFGSVELVSWAPTHQMRGGGEAQARIRLIRRVVRGRFGAGLVARALARREERALRHLREAGVTAIAREPGIPDEVLEALRSLPTEAGELPRRGEVYLRPFAEGLPLHRAERLPRNFFQLLDEAARELHAAGVCHNDLHKEQNIVVGEDGRPVLIDFQLATLHPRRPTKGMEGRWFRARCLDDIRHVQKHRRRYTRDGRGPLEERVADSERMKRTGIPLVWMKTGKPVYKFVTRRLLRTRDGEEMRPSSGPWPSWGEAVGPVSATASASASDPALSSGSTPTDEAG